MMTFPCPKCGRTLEQSGEFIVGELIMPTFQCDDCIVPRNILGVDTEVNLTFCLDNRGNVCDPASPDGELHF